MDENNFVEDNKVDDLDDFIEKLLVACESPCDIYRIYVNIISGYKELAIKYYKPFLDKLYSLSQDVEKRGRKITAHDYYQMLVDFEIKQN